MTTLHTSYRPAEFRDVLGQDAAVKVMESAVEHRDFQCFLLSGPSGVGKTTLARITARAFNTALTEVDAATYTGVEDMRKIQEMTQYRPLTGEDGKAVIIDEAHRLSPQAWDSILKATEEPPEGVYWFFCTTNPIKMPKTMQTRCLHLQLKPLDKNDLTDLVEYVAAEEGIELPDAIRQLVVARAEGSARQALVNLAACRDIKDRTEAAEVLQAVEEQEETIDLLRLLARGNAQWGAAMGLLEKLDSANPESIRIQAVNYFAAAAQNAKNDQKARFFLGLMEQFSASYANYEAKAQLLRSIGHCIFWD
jgi:DNA polymerase III gamma/tau subunit